ncbi:TPA: fimbria/pilus outer membrane usher protein [Providencia alcalifaciens]
MHCLIKQKRKCPAEYGSVSSVHNGMLNFKVSAVAIVILSIIQMHHAAAEDYFNPNALSIIDGQQVADIQSLEQFSKPGGQMAGTYHVDVMVNGRFVTAKEVEFIEDNTKKQLIPVLTKQELAEWGVKVAGIPTLAALPEGQAIGTIGDYIPDAKATLELTQQKLNLSIPQIAMDKTAADAISPDLWENGLPALVLNYYYSGSNNWSRTGGEDTNNHYFNLRSGLNIGAWRVKNYSTYTDTSGQRDWKNIETSVERGINFLKSQLIMGDTSTPSDMFDGFQFRGIQLQSDESMLPSSMRGFAPIIRGIAQSNAEVTIKQNGYVIYQSYVAPGAFEIDDLYSTGTSGDLTVTVKEADGSERSFVVPFSTMPIMQREGQLKYSVTGGKYKSNGDNEHEPAFFQGTAMYGLPKGFTGYFGALLSKDYQSYAVGLGVNLGTFGALSADITQANTQNLNGKNTSDSGQSYRFQYSKNLTSTGTSVTLANYRYSTEGFYSFSEANSNRHEYYRDNKKNRVQLSLSQSLEKLGSVYFSIYQQDYWNRSGNERTIGAGYNNNIEGITFNVNYNYSTSSFKTKPDSQISVSVSIPLNSSVNSTSITTNIMRDNNGYTDTMVGVNGSFLDDNNLSYSVQQSYGNKDVRASGSASASYRGGFGIMNAGYGYDRNSQRANYGVTGAIVAHPYGVTLSQPIYDAFAIVRAPGANNVKVMNRTGVTTDARGYAIVPYLTSYSKNEVSLSVDSLPENVELKINTKTVVPTKGAAVLADFETHVGYRLLFNVSYRGKPIPFGAMASMIENNPEASSAIANENGDIYLSGMPEQGRFQVKWGKQSQDQCVVDYQLTPEQIAQYLPILPVECR